MKKIFAAIAAVVALSLFSGCAMFEAFGEQWNREWNGVSAQMTTYNDDGIPIDSIHGSSFNVTRDTRFDTSDSEGTSNKDSSVLLISLGTEHISHVGSSMTMVQDGLVNIMDETNAVVEFNNTDRGTPWLNDLYEMHRNVWKGKAKTIMIRSQEGTPIAVYTGSEVEILATDVPKSTWFRIDGKFLFVYRSDYTVTDTTLLEG